MLPADNNAAALAHESFNRPPRIWISPPQGQVTIPTPPHRDPLPSRPSLITLLMPIFAMSILIGISLAFSHGSTQSLAFLLPMAIISIVTPLANLFTAYQRVKAIKRKWRQNESKYRELLEKLRARLIEQVREQRQVALLKDPDLSDMEMRIKERTRLWERRPEDPDFLNVRVGKGAQPFTVELLAPEIDTAEPLLDEVQKLINEFSSVEDIPCGVSLTGVKSLGITGKRQLVADFARGLLCQIATHHSPEDVRLFGIYPQSQKQDWEWLANLPHTRPLKTGKQDRLLAAGQDEADQLLNILLEELSQRASKKNEGENTAADDQAMPLPHLVVIIHDYVEVRKHPALTHAFKLGEQLGVSVIYLVAQEQAIPGECRGVIRLSDEGSLTYAAAGFAGETLQNITPDIMDVKMARRIAFLLSPLQVAAEGEDTIDLPANVRLLDLLQIPYADQLNVETWWSQPPFGRLRVPLGQGVKDPVWIDFNESGHGPHGIIAGTTGAGKSELLQSLIVGLAVTHHPHIVNFVLVDFKGGATFKPFEKIPHTVGMVTDLSGRLTERALTALKSELRRREHILSNANAKNIVQYQALRSQNSSFYEPLPHLFIIIDEFAELAKEHPTFMEGLVSVVQKGRSLGVHLILATQKPTGSVNANIWSNLKFRICLRVASLQDSRDMLGRSEAALLPSSLPGRAYFQIGSEIFTLFQSARISLPARISAETSTAANQAADSEGEVTDQQVLMSLIEPYQQTLGVELFRPWPDPLPQRISLPDVYERLDMPRRVESLESGQPPYGWLTFPVGLIDLPVEQRQEPLMIDMPRQGGHVLVAGASGSGKSVFLRTLITSLVQTHTSSQLHLYLIDFGGQALRAFDKLPHVGGIFGEADEDYIRRLLRKLRNTIEERKQVLATYHIDDFYAYQRRRADQPNLPEMPAIVTVIDKFLEFRQAHDKDMDLLLSIARHGRAYGIYLVLSVDRPVGIPTQLMSLIELRIGMRMVEMTDSLVLLGRNDAVHLDPAVPGRGFKRGSGSHPIEVHIALPVSCEDDDEQTGKLDELVAALAREAEGPSAPPIQLLPEYVRFDDLLTEVALRNSSPRVPGSLHLPLGIEDLSLQPISLELNSDTLHLLVGGGPGSGRTGILQSCMMALAKTSASKQAQVILVDFRRSSRPFRRLPNMWMYVDNEERLVAAIDKLKTELRERMAQLHEELEKQQMDDIDEPVGLNLAPMLLVIDDYDQLSVLTKNPLNDLREFLPQARDLSLHLLVAGSPGDLARNELLLQQVRACRMGIVLGGDPADQPLLGVRISDLPPGRGYLVRRNQRNLIQFGHLDQATLLPSMARLVQSPG